MAQLQTDMQIDIDRHVEYLKKVTKECDDANDAQRGAISMFSESKRYESDIHRLQSEVHQWLSKD
jgi:hypothetical protein